MNEFQIKLLSYLNITEEEYLELIKDVNINDLENPYNFLNMQKAVDRINLAINNNEKIMIYGDYDCDGISATAILVKAFMYLNKKVGYYIPSRYIDGYGLNLTRAKQIKDKPTAIIAKTIKGKGISFMENKVEWHGKAPSDEEYKLAIDELIEKNKEIEKKAMEYAN